MPSIRRYLGRRGRSELRARLFVELPHGGQAAERGCAVDERCGAPGRCRPLCGELDESRAALRGCSSGGCFLGLVSLSRSRTAYGRDCRDAAKTGLYVTSRAAMVKRLRRREGRGRSSLVAVQLYGVGAGTGMSRVVWCAGGQSVGGTRLRAVLAGVWEGDGAIDAYRPPPASRSWIVGLTGYAGDGASAVQTQIISRSGDCAGGLCGARGACSFIARAVSRSAARALCRSSLASGLSSLRSLAGRR